MEKISDKKLKFRDQLKFYCEKRYNCDFDKNLNSFKQSKIQTEFFISEVYNKTREEIPEDEFENYFVDRTNDLGIDFIHKNNDVWTIIQTKYRGVGKKEDNTEIIKFKDLLNRIYFNADIAHEELKGILSDIDFDNDRFRMIFITLGSFSDNANAEIITEPSFAENLQGLKDRVEFHYYDEKLLDIELRNADSLSRGARDIKHVFYPQENPDGKRSQVIELTLGKRKQYILTVSANHLVDIYNQNGVRDQLFSLNIRNFIGNVGFNKKIKLTAIDRPEDFFYFNNGISCLASYVNHDLTSGKVEVQGLQIINGAQTVKTLSDVRAKTNLKKLTILVRITDVDVGYAESGRFIEEITEYNNSQNVIKSSDFRSNDSIQKFLENEFGKLKYNANPVKYIRKRTTASKSKYEIIKMEDFTKVLHAFLINPIDFSSSTKYLYGIEENEGYVRVYGDGKKLYDAFTVNEFKLRAAIWWLASEFLKKIKSDSNDLKIQIENSKDEKNNKNNSLKANALQGKWFIIYTSKLLLERKYGQDYINIISRYYDKTWRFDDKKHGVWFNELYTLSKSVVQEVYAEAALGPDQIVLRNWLRSKEALSKIESKCNFGARLELSSDLPVE